jgi:sugar/nucleoside kinase (ribokinase family)
MDHEGYHEGIREAVQSSEPGPAVCVVGNVNVDMLMKPVAGIPAWGTETLVDNYEERLGGCAGNSALVRASLGQDTRIVASVGEDRMGRELTSMLSRSGVRLDGLHRSEQATGVSLSLNRPDGERLFVTYPGAMFETKFQEISGYLSAAPDCKALLLTGYFLLSPEIDAQKVFQLAKKLGMLTLFDTGWPTQEWTPEVREEILALLAEVDYFLPNELEACALTQTSSYLEAAAILAEKCRKGVVIKRGGEGSYYCGKDGTIQTSGYKVQVKDTVGAGDSFNAGFIYGITRDWPLASCVELGNAVAASVISGTEGFNIKWSQVFQFMGNSLLSHKPS